MLWLASVIQSMNIVLYSAFCISLFSIMGCARCNWIEFAVVFSMVWDNHIIVDIPWLLVEYREYPIESSLVFSLCSMVCHLKPLYIWYIFIVILFYVSNSDFIPSQLNIFLYNLNGIEKFLHPLSVLNKQS